MDIATPLECVAICMHLLINIFKSYLHKLFWLRFHKTENACRASCKNNNNVEVDINYSEVDIKNNHTFPIKLSFSLRNFEESIAATSTLRAPSGVTSAAGANAYASRFAASPIPTGN